MLFHKNTKKTLGWVTVIIGVLIIISMVLVYVAPLVG
jgi:hypothetical protein